MTVYIEAILKKILNLRIELYCLKRHGFRGEYNHRL